MSAGTGIDVVVGRRVTVADDVIELELHPADTPALPEWRPGAHIDVVTGDGTARPYSLCGDPADLTAYRIAVLNQPRGRGGSAWLHHTLREGDRLTVRGPRNHFPLEPAPGYVFLAGGIGITPLLPMIRQATAAGVPWTLHYGGRTRTSMAYADDLLASAPAQVHLVPFDEHGLLDLEGVTATAPADSLIYCCGPEPLLTATESACAALGLRLHTERFTPREPAPSTENGEFTVRIASTGAELTVPADRSIADVLADAGVDVLTSCEEGTCGTCETPVLAGHPDHRDSVLTPEEQHINDRLLICVSRSHTPCLVLDL